MSPLDPALDVFLSHARIEKGLSPNSVDAYGRDLRRYAADLSARKLPGFTVKVKKVTQSSVEVEIK